ncbi:MAG: hypothetical protein KA218_00555 [Arenimonas sp.]|nr:hypothetical protein [Arenimonas sp.]
MKQALKRYNHRMLVTMSLYVLLVFTSVWILRYSADGWPVFAKALLAVSPVVPVAYFGKAFVVYLNECDELMRRIELEAIGLSSLVVGLLFLSLGFLGRAKVIALDGVTVAVWVFPLLCGFYGLTKWFASRRYR